MEVNIQVTKNFKFLMENKNARIVVLEGSSRCFHSEQLIVTEAGNKSIKDLEVGDKVLSYNETTNLNEYKPVRGLHEFKNENKCLKITLKNGTVIKCTEEHEFYYEGAWISIKHLLSLHNNKLNNKKHGDLENS